MTVRAIHKQPVQLWHQRRLLLEQPVQPRNIHPRKAVTFKPLAKHRGHHIDLADSIFGMLGGGAGKVGHRVMGAGKGVPVVAPDPPAFNADEQQHDHQHETQDQAEQWRRTPFAWRERFCGFVPVQVIGWVHTGPCSIKLPPL
ncbi:hypothetical protein D3C85_1471130 [compost metagenome]